MGRGSHAPPPQPSSRRVRRGPPRRHGAGATITSRKGKLVATSRLTGKLPDNIIDKATNAAALNGYPHAALRSMSIPAQAAHTQSGATLISAGPSLPADGVAPGFTISFTVPPDHQDGAPLYLDTVFEENSSGACGFVYATGGATGPIGGFISNGGWELPPGTTTFGTIALSAGPENAFTRTFLWNGASEPGDVVSLTLNRQGTHVADTCAEVTFYAFQVRY